MKIHLEQIKTLTKFYGEKKISFRSFRIHKNMRWTRYRTGKEGTIGLAELKKFCSKINCKVSNSVLREKFTKYDAPNTGEIGFDDFCNILQELLLGNKSLYLETFGRWVIFDREKVLGIHRIRFLFDCFECFDK